MELFAYLIFICALCSYETVGMPDVQTLPTLPVKQRIELLKFEIKDHLKKLRKGAPPNDKGTLGNEGYDYLDLTNMPVTPINENDKRKINNVFKMRELKTKQTTATPTTETALSLEHHEEDTSIMKELNVKRYKKRKAAKQKGVPLPEIFYRRTFNDYDTPLKWVHCHDMLTPFFKGMKTDLATAKKLMPKDRNVYRFLQLIKVNATGFSKEDIFSLLYQLSNMDVRLFHWDFTAVKLLLNAVSPQRIRASFATLKKGVKDLFKRWQLDFSNTTNLLKQTRIYRPHCITAFTYTGSTKSSLNTKYTRKTKKHKVKEVKDNSDDF